MFRKIKFAEEKSTYIHVVYEDGSVTDYDKSDVINNQKLLGGETFKMKYGFCLNTDTGELEVLGNELCLLGLINIIVCFLTGYSGLTRVLFYMVKTV